ncbi:hypothetical protein SGFS_055920 [Streptomyces graminofaciens]|uniref:Aminopeptidase N n=1 Tax=Streptomyces graminofaciens TaxID=68212 RepID=A0ABN5VLG7_9ACTN|nr:M1 family metallopeptidase [Streptomyces graminofaciens]BBC34298.1 hypothetical protein SGFS_055920 [Streptomyces graminofaciens]
MSRPVPFAPAALLALTLTFTLTLTACTGDGGDRGDTGGAHGTSGAAGLKDPYFPKMGNGGYDVTHYALTLDYDPDDNDLKAEAVITARAEQNLSAFNLDLKGLKVDGVKVDGAPARWNRAGQELTVRPAAGLTKDKTFRTTVRYSGSPKTITDPDGSEEGWLRTGDDDEGHGVLALGEPTGSMTWFPGNHHPSDKATYDITVTVPEGVRAVSNGELRSEGKSRSGGVTTTWHTAQPMASYLATVAIGPYVIRTSTTDDGLPVYVAVDPSQVQDSRKVLDRIPEVMEWAEDNFGAYPFTSTGVIVDRPEAVGYALETQNRPVFPGAPDISLLVHELAHQWYGDSVTPESWRDMWLNEGFATYAEWLWQEDHDGDSAQDTFDAVYEGDYFSDTESSEAVWDFPPADPPSAARISDSPVYERGAMVLHKIRETVGDDTFYDIIRGWAATHRHGNASTADFTKYVEEKAPDEDFDVIWKEWLYGEGKPSSP